MRGPIQCPVKSYKRNSSGVINEKLLHISQKWFTILYNFRSPHSNLNCWSCPIMHIYTLLTHWVRDKMADIFQMTFSNAFSWNKNVWTLTKISLKFVPKGPINNIPSLVQIMAWRRSGDKPLSEPMMVSLLTNICVARPQWVNPPKQFYVY